MIAVGFKSKFVTMAKRDQNCAIILDEGATRNPKHKKKNQKK